MNNKTAVIIGAGLGGLSIACLLAQKGYKVTVLEKNSHAGGRINTFKTKGFLFDLGPSFYQMPKIFEDFFKKFDKNIHDYFKLKRLNPSYRMFFGRKDKVDISSNLNDNVKLFESYEKGAGQKLKDFLAQAKYQYDTSMSYFLYKEYRNIFDFFSWKMIKEGYRLHVFDNMDKFTSRFFKNDRLIKILQYTLVFLGGSPKHTPAIYSLMAHVDFNLGVWYPMGGMSKLSESMKELAISLGVKFKFNEPATKILIKDNRATSVKSSKSIYQADIVVANADYYHVEKKLLEEPYRNYNEKYWDNKTVAPSAFIIVLGLNKKIKSFSHHNFLLENDWMEHFDQIFEDPKWPDNPSIYICAPSVTDPSVAPKGQENLFILVPVASNLKDTPQIRDKFYKSVIKAIEHTVGENIEDSIIVKKIFAHNDFKEIYNAYKGTALGLSHTLMQTAFFRPSHTNKKISNLYYTGHYTHPGIGMPIQFISSQIVSDLIEKNEQTTH